MSQENQDLEALIEARLVRVNAAAFGLVVGVIAGAGLLLATNWLVLKGGEHPGPHLGLLSNYFPGYTVTVAGSLIGFGYAFVCGLLAGGGGAWLYNQVARLRQRPEGGEAPR